MTKAQFNKLMDLSLRQTQEIERLRIALRQASFYIRALGEAGADKEFTMRIVNAALDRESLPLAAPSGITKEE